MKKRKKVIILMLIVIEICFTYLTYMSFNSKNEVKELNDIKEEKTIDRKQFAMYVKQDGKYVEYNGTDENKDLFPTGYKLNSDESRCEDIDGNTIDVTMTPNTNDVTITSNKTAYCYLYFDKQLSVDDLEKYDTTNTLNDNLVGGMYRYQGAYNVVKNNYICLGKLNDKKCANQSNNMYRIIGITPEGNIKVIKQTRYGDTYQWWTDYSRIESNKEWPNSLIFDTLNDTFYNSLNEEIKNKIEPQEWLYGDISSDLVTKDYITAEQAYMIETGQANTKYYDPSNGSYIQNKKWEKKTDSKPIGLMYVHDYAYSGSTEGDYTSCRVNYSTCKTSWIHMSNNGGATSGSEAWEWTMTRLGRSNSSDTYFYVWGVDLNGQVYALALQNAFAVRPVFYLSSNVELGGEGSTSDPFYIAN